MAGEIFHINRQRRGNAAQALRAYDRAGIVLEGEPPDRDCADKKGLIGDNVALLTEQVSSHPETTYRFLIPPFSMLWRPCCLLRSLLRQEP